MVDDPAIANQISDLMQNMLTQIGKCSSAVLKGCSQEEYKAFVRSISHVTSAIVFDVMQPLYLKHPDLKPPNWEDLPEVLE
jgi:hypothetical protein